MNYFFNPKARAEHLEVVAYYESQQKGLGKRYLTAFNSVMTRVCATLYRNKLAFPPDIRLARVVGFPHNILYRVVKKMLKC